MITERFELQAYFVLSAVRLQPSQIGVLWMSAHGNHTFGHGLVRVSHSRLQRQKKYNRVTENLGKVNNGKDNCMHVKLQRFDKAN
jgi:hypothetical protein